MHEVSFYPIQDIWLYLVAVFVLEALAVCVWQYRQSKGALPLAAALLNRALWILSLIIIGTVEELGSKLFWVTIQQMTVILPVFFWLVFLLQITNRGQWITSRTRTALLLVPTLTCLLLFSNSWHGLYWEKVSLNGEVLTFVRGFGNWLMLFYNGLLILPAIYLSGLWLKESTGLRRRQAIIVVLAPISGLVGAAIWIFMRNTEIFSPLPLSSLISGIVFTYGFFYLRFINLLPLAHAKAVEVAGNGLAVIDKEGWVVELNAAAADILEVIPAQAEGKQAAEVFANWPVVVASLKTEHAIIQEICLKKNNHIRYYEMYSMNLADRRSSSMGKAFIWKEITAQKEVQKQLVEQEKLVSVLAERNRIGRNFHDGPGQLGGYLQMELQTILILLQKEQIKDVETQIKRLLETAKDFNVEVRETIADLKTGASSAQDFLYLLKTYLDRYQKNYGINTELILPSQPLAGFLNHMAALHLLRIIQEATNNIRKHAKANKVTVKLEVSARKAIVIVADNGQGFEVSQQLVNQNQYGLAIMRERVAEIEGELRFESAIGAGTKVIIEIPLGKEEHHESIVS